MCAVSLWVRLQTGEKCISVEGERVLVGALGLFVREVQLPIGTPVVIRFCRGQDEVSLRGTVCANYLDLGLSVEFKKSHSRASERIGGTTMKVHELTARLERADPEDSVLIDTDSRWLFLLNQRTAMCQPLNAHEAGGTLTEPDKEFLRILRVRF